MPYVMLQFDRPEDVRNWNEYNRRARGWIDRLLKQPGTVAFNAYRTADGSSPNTMVMLEFATLEEARKGSASEATSSVVEELRSLRVWPKMFILERSPYTPEPIRA
jgi:hypothetical protein